MDGSNRFGKKSPQIREWIAQAPPLRKATTVKKMNDRSLLLYINEIIHYFKKRTTGSGFLKKIYFLQKNVMLQIDSLKSSCSQKQQYPKRTLRLKVLRKSSSLEKQLSHLQVQLFTTALLKHLLYFMNKCNYCCEIVKLTKNNCSKSHPCKWHVYNCSSKKATILNFQTPHFILKFLKK